MTRVVCDMLILNKPPEKIIDQYFAVVDIDEIVRLARNGYYCEYMDLLSKTYYFRKEARCDE